MSGATQPDRAALRVVVTGMGMVSAAGEGVDVAWRHLAEGLSALSPIRTFDPVPYARTVAAAVKEVEDAMAEEERRRDYSGFLKQRLKAAGETVKEGFLLYRNGAGDYLSYLGALTSFQRLERRVETEKAGLAKARVGVFRALGGNWTGDPAKWGAGPDERGNGKK